MIIAERLKMVREWNGTATDVYHDGYKLIRGTGTGTKTVAHAQIVLFYSSVASFSELLI